MGKPVYKLLDQKGRILIPQELGTQAGMSYGDIVGLRVQNGNIEARKVDVIEIGDQSPGAVEAYVRAAFRTMPDDTRISLISELSKLLNQKEGGRQS